MEPIEQAIIDVPEGSSGTVIDMLARRKGEMVDMRTEDGHSRMEFKVPTRGLLGWASQDRLPTAFKLLQTRIVEPHSLEGDPGSVYLWVEQLDDDNRPSGIPRSWAIFR